MAGSISGTVTDASTGKPVTGAAVALYDSSGMASHTMSQASGAYSFGNVPAGAGSVGASHPDYTAGSGSSFSIVLASGAAGKADLTLYPAAGSLSGTILDAATNLPVEGAAVRVLEASGNLLGTYTTDG